MTRLLLTLIIIALAGCADPEPDDSIVTIHELRDHPGHPCEPLLPLRKGARNSEYEAAEACTVEHCIGRAGALDPKRDARQLRTLCMGDEAGLVWSLKGCRWAACERLLPAVPGIAYKLSTTSGGLLETEAWAGPITESSVVLTDILTLGPKASCGEVLRLAAVLETMVIEDQTLPWDMGSARAALRLARWHQANCPSHRGSFVEVLYLVPPDILEQLRREEAGDR
jgi:hypothetical protein